MKANGPSKLSDEQLDAALAQIDSILSIFGALLRIGTLEAGSGRARFAEVNLSLLTQQLFEAYSPVADDAQHSLIAKLEADKIVQGDSDLLAQAITNLLENAILHTPSGTNINLELKHRHDGIALVVADDGPGIDASERSNVLRRFYRLDHSRQSSGVGLGLALVSAIVAMHDARLSLSENRPGLRVTILFAS